MKTKKVLIIGGGIAGLCTGVYLRRSGFDTEILEMHSIAGGLATAWKREGYTFENCIHWLVGSKEGQELNATWNEVFDLGQLEFYNDDVYQVIETGSRRLVVYRNVDRMEREFLAVAPEDAASIREFAELVRMLTSFKMPVEDSFYSRLATYAKALPHLGQIRRHSKFTLAEYAKRFKNPLLRSFFDTGLSELSLLAIAFSLAWMSNGNAGYPIGGSLKMIGLIQNSYHNLGGKIRFSTKVEKIIVENGRAVGVLLAGGECVAADIIVSAADGHETIFQFLEGKFLSDKIQRAYQNYKPFPSYVQVSTGINADLKGQPGFYGICLDHALPIDPETKADFLSFRIFNFDPTFAPPGKTAVICFIPTYNYEYWVSLDQRDREQYDAEKSRIADGVIGVFGEKFPAARNQFEVIDIATPATVIRYTGNWKGSMEGWLMTPATGIRPLPMVLPGLRDFYMVGQWISPGGGLPSGLLTARSVTQKICKDNRIPFSAAKSHETPI